MDAHRLELDAKGGGAKCTLVEKNPGDVVQWFVDDKLQVGDIS